MKYFANIQRETTYFLLVRRCYNIDYIPLEF